MPAASASMETAIAASRGISPAEAAIATAVSITAVITEAYTEAIGIPVIAIGISIGVVRIGVPVCDRGCCGIIAGGRRSITWSGSLTRLIVAVARSLIGEALVAVGRILR